MRIRLELVANKLVLLLIVFVVLIIFTGCARMKWLDEKLGEGFKKIEELKYEEIIKDPEAALKALKPVVIIATSTLIEVSNNLTQEQKEKIDKWLKDQGLNRYGDPEDTDYIGGTPLFNEATGESIERYFYIVMNHPEVVSLIQ